jgi:hypothetical protein
VNEAQERLITRQVLRSMPWRWFKWAPPVIIAFVIGKEASGTWAVVLVGSLWVLLAFVDTLGRLVSGALLLKELRAVDGVERPLNVDAIEDDLFGYHQS